MPGTWGILIRAIGWAPVIDQLMSGAAMRLRRDPPMLPKQKDRGMGLSCPITGTILFDCCCCQWGMIDLSTSAAAVGGSDMR